MRLITEKEDKLLEKINLYGEEIRKLEIEEIELKGTFQECKEKRQAEFTKVMFWSIVSSLGFVLSMGYLIVGINSPTLAASVFFAAGGIGFIIIAVWLITIYVFIRYISRTSHSKRSQNRENEDNISYVEDKTMKSLNVLRDKLTKFRTAKEIAQNEYEDLKNELDDLYEQGKINDKKIVDEINKAQDSLWQGNKYEAGDVIKGSEKFFEMSQNNEADIANYQTYEPWTNDDSPRGNYNKLRAESIRIQNKKSQYQEVLESYNFRYENAKKSIIYAIAFLGLIVLALIIAIIQAFSKSADIMDIKVICGLAVIIIASVIIFSFVFLYSLPTVSSGKIAKRMAAVTGSDHLKLEMDKMEKEMDDIDSRVIAIKEEMRLLKSEIDNSKNDMPYLY